MGWSTNEKALEKKRKEQEKKDTKEREKHEKKQSEKWKCEQTQKKLQNAQQKQERKARQLRRKQQLKQLQKQQQQEMEKQNKKNRSQFNAKKLTQAQIQAKQQEALIKNYEKQLANEQQKYFKSENPNHKFADYEVAETVDQALQILETKEDKHPEKRYKAAFEAYCEKRQPLLKIDYPKLKRSQRIQAMRKQFQKHPDNPHNMKTTKYNYKTEKKPINEEDSD